MWFKRFFQRRNREQAVYRRDWGTDAKEPLAKLEVALDAITPSYDDCSMRIIYREAGRFVVSIAFYNDICFSPPIKATHHVVLEDGVVAELITKQYLIPFFFFVAPDGDPKMFAVSDLGEKVWAQMIGN